MLPLLALDTDAPTRERDARPRRKPMLDAEVKVDLTNMRAWGKIHIAPKVKVDYSKVEASLGYRSKEYNGRDPASDWERNEARLLDQVTRFKPVLELYVARLFGSALVARNMIPPTPGRTQWEFFIDFQHEEEFRNEVMPQFQLKILDEMKRALRFAGGLSNKAFKDALEAEFWAVDSRNTPSGDPMWNSDHRQKVLFPKRIQNTNVEWGPLETDVQDSNQWLYTASAVVTLWTIDDSFDESSDEEGSPAPKKRRGLFDTKP